MEDIIEWYSNYPHPAGWGFFQIGGGVAGDYPICVVPLIKLESRQQVNLFSYHCQICDGNTSYSGYSATTPNDKLTWSKLGQDHSAFVIESDATIVWPLVCSYVLAGQ